MAAPLTKRTLIAASGALAASRAFGQAAPAPPPARPRVILTTSLGLITLELAADKAPISTANFLRYADHKRLDGTHFYRASKGGMDPPSGLIQGGPANDPARVYHAIAHESTTLTGLHHLDGTISLARLEPGSATCDFFICVGAQPYLDADPSAPGDNLGFAAFGQVVDGMDVVRRILLSPTSPTKGEGAMRGQMLEPPIPIISARGAA
jgi:peptidyl-prolyl cis-trans isomerase A (cyclophilin A)